MPSTRTVRPRFARRTALVCAGGACLVGTAGLAGCAEYGAQPAPAEPEAGGEAPAGASGPVILAAVADVPVGGAVILAEQEVVLTQPAEGQVLGFSHACTHQGCPVTAVEEDEIVCACHGSRFALDGSVAQGPAASPLAPVEVRVDGQDVVLGGA